MGLFDKIFGQAAPAPAELNKQESFAAIALATSAADGHISDTEVQSMMGYLFRMRMFETYNDHQMSTMFDKLIKMLRKDGPPGLIASAKKNLPEDLRQTAFACAVDIALADGVLEESEKELLTELQKVLEVPENIAITLIQAMLIKNKG